VDGLPASATPSVLAVMTRAQRQKNGNGALDEQQITRHKHSVAQPDPDTTTGNTGTSVTDQTVTAVGNTSGNSHNTVVEQNKAKKFLNERLAIIRKVRDALARAQEKQKEYADRHGRKNKEHFSVGDAVLLSTHNLPKEAISNLPGGTTKLLPRYIGPFKVLKEVSDVNYQLDIPSAMKLHPVFYVGRLKRYVDPTSATYPAPRALKSTNPTIHPPRRRAMNVSANESEDVDVAQEQQWSQPQDVLSLPSTSGDQDRDRAANAIPAASPCATTEPHSGASAPTTPRSSNDSRSKRQKPRSRQRAETIQRSVDQSAGSGEANARTFRRVAPVALTDSDGDKRYLVEAIVDYRLRPRHGSEYLVRWRGYPPDQDSWEPEATLLADVPDLIADFKRSQRPHSQ
jgi:hypothetical protein